MNPVEAYKEEKDGLDVLQDVPRYAAEGWEAITEEGYELYAGKHQFGLLRRSKNSHRAASTG